jgi:PAP_fibrillin
MSKTKLLDAIAGKNRGLLASPTDRQAILTAIAELEADNPHSRPLVDGLDLLAGNWRLLYTSSQSLLGIDRVPLIQLGEIYQCLRMESQTLYNIAEVSNFIPGLNGLVSVVASFEAVNERRVNVRFNRSIIGLKKLLKYQYPDDLITAIENGQRLTAIDLPINNSSQNAWVDITYLDETIRVGRGNEGNVFVLTK